MRVTGGTNGPTRAAMIWLSVTARMTARMCAGHLNNSVVSEGSIIPGIPDRLLYGNEDILLGTAEESIIPGIPDDRWLYGNEDILLGTANPGDDVLDEDDEIIGEAVDWPFGPPDLRTEIRIKQLRGEFPKTTIISLKEQQQRREAEEAAALAETEELLRTVGLKANAAKRLLRAHPRIAKLPVEQLREHLAYIREVFPRGDAAASVVTGAQSLLGHAQLQETLPLKLATIERETGLDATQVALLAPSLLNLNEGSIHTRCERLLESLHELQLDAEGLRSVLRRAPRLLHYKSETVRASFDELCRQLPADADAADVARRQPTLLGGNLEILCPKLDLLRELCSDAEWADLVRSSSFARALTASTAVIERLRTLPARPDGSPRAIITTLLMTKGRWEAVTGLSQGAGAYSKWRKPGKAKGPRSAIRQRRGQGQPSAGARASSAGARASSAGARASRAQGQVQEDSGRRAGSGPRKKMHDLE